MPVQVLGGVVKRIGIFSPATFQRSFIERLILQKVVYLLERGWGIDLGYRFNLYMRGPYSPDLAREAYELVEVYDRLPGLKFSDSKTEAKFEQFLAFIEPHKGDEAWLELAANMIWFWRKGHKTEEALAARLAGKSRKFTRERCAEIYADLLKAGVLQ